MLVYINGFTRDRHRSTVQDTVQQHRNGSGGDGDELVLDVIEIKGRVDKPSVIIMPKRIEPEVGEVELERDFEQELKEGIGEIPRPEDDMNKVERVQSIKKTVERDRE
jgi:hypothetical protein